MDRRLKKKLVASVAVLAVLAGVTTAVVMAAQPAHHHHASAIATAADYLGLSQARLRGELRSGRSLAQVANATDGKSAAGLVAALEKQKLAAAAASLPGRIAFAVDRPRGAGARSGTLRAAAGYLGVSAAQLRTEERAGKTLAQIADSTSGKSSAGLLDALVAVRRAAIDAAVKARTITRAQADKLLSSLVERITARVKLEHHRRPQRAQPQG